ncbi:hypothetical protein SLA2020_140830 [Shorea laevis]
MRCKATPVEDELVTCFTCATSWHLACLTCPPESLASMLRWDCPDCTGDNNDDEMFPAVGGEHSSGLVAAIKEIESDVTLSEQDKARKRQELLSGKPVEADKKGKRKAVDLDDDEDVLEILDESLNCSVCLQLLDRPAATPCGHNFCLKCFQKWCTKGNQSCANYRQEIPKKMKMEPRINSALVTVIRMEKSSRSTASSGPSRSSRVIHDDNKPENAYTTKRTKRRRKANGAIGRIFVIVPNGNFGPILPEHDPQRNQGVLVGEIWEDRFECRQWGVHFPLVGGIAGQNKVGAQSVVLSGGYQDEDHRGWFLYSGNGGRNLRGNKRTSKKQSFHQKFTQLNQSLRVSCIEGYPIRVVRSHKEKRSCYAPDGKGLRYDGIYRIEMCWRTTGAQGFKICRYLFVRCDNSPAPWTSDEHGDHPRPLPVIKELKEAFDITKRKEAPSSWGFDEADGKWKWLKPPPGGKVKSENSGKRKRRAARKQGRQTIRQRLLREFSCLICQQVLTMPVTTTCGHNFCKTCLENAFSGKSIITERSAGGKTLRSIKNFMHCPFFSQDIADFLSNIQVNREVMDLIERLKRKTEKNEGGSVQQVSENEEAENDNEVSENDQEGENDEEVSVNEEAMSENEERERDEEESESEEGENDEEVSEEVSENDDEVSENEEGENDEEESDNEEGENDEEVSENDDEVNENKEGENDEEESENEEAENEADFFVRLQEGC